MECDSEGRHGDGGASHTKHCATCCFDAKVAISASSVLPMPLRYAHASMRLAPHDDVTHVLHASQQLA